ncbi:MAG TPA: hypothetical protein VGO45_08205 [Bacteroidia bacterium]|jgi:hypothetical protein|nr:hypothetical protein [Bacteroidia bacterium]
MNIRPCNLLFFFWMVLCIPTLAQVTPLEQVNVFEAADTVTRVIPKTDTSPYPQSHGKFHSMAQDAAMQRGSGHTYAERVTHWVLKCDPILLSRGVLPVFLERRLSRFFSVEGAMGITFEDYFKEFFIQGRQLYDKDPNAVKMNGMSAKLAVRYFPKHEGLSGLYISPELDFTNYRKQEKGIYINSAGRFTQGALLDQQKYVDLLAVLGTQNTNEAEREVYLDWYVGLGMRAGYEDNVGNDESNSGVIRVTHSEKISPILVFGLKLGLGF